MTVLTRMLTSSSVLSKAEESGNLTKILLAAATSGARKIGEISRSPNKPQTPVKLTRPQVPKFSPSVTSPLSAQAASKSNAKVFQATNPLAKKTGNTANGLATQQEWNPLYNRKTQVAMETVNNKSSQPIQQRSQAIAKGVSGSVVAMGTPAEIEPQNSSAARAQAKKREFGKYTCEGTPVVASQVISPNADARTYRGPNAIGASFYVVARKNGVRYTPAQVRAKVSLDNEPTMWNLFNRQTVNEEFGIRGETRAMVSKIVEPNVQIQTGRVSGSCNIPTEFGELKLNAQVLSNGPFVDESGVIKAPGNIR